MKTNGEAAKPKEFAVNLGELQLRLVAARKLAASNEKVLLRAQEARDASAKELERATQWLREAARTVVG